jgi:hypothetical protein
LSAWFRNVGTSSPGGAASGSVENERNRLLHVARDLARVADHACKASASRRAALQRNPHRMSEPAGLAGIAPNAFGDLATQTASGLAAAVLGSHGGLC